MARSPPSRKGRQGLKRERQSILFVWWVLPALGDRLLVAWLQSSGTLHEPVGWAHAVCDVDRLLVRPTVFGLVRHYSRLYMELEHRRIRPSVALWCDTISIIGDYDCFPVKWPIDDPPGQRLVRQSAFIGARCFLSVTTWRSWWWVDNAVLWSHGQDTSNWPISCQPSHEEDSNFQCHGWPLYKDTNACSDHALRDNFSHQRVAASFISRRRWVLQANRRELLWNKGRWLVRHIKWGQSVIQPLQLESSSL